MIETRVEEEARERAVVKKAHMMPLKTRLRVKKEIRSTASMVVKSAFEALSEITDERVRARVLVSSVVVLVRDMGQFEDLCDGCDCGCAESRREVWIVRMVEYGTSICKRSINCQIEGKLSNDWSAGRSDRAQDFSKSVDASDRRRGGPAMEWFLTTR